MEDPDRTASLMTPAQLAQVKPKPPMNPGAWLDQMASDAGHQNIKRLGELVDELRSQARQRDFAPLGSSLSRLAEALPRLDFGLLRSKGLLARLSGKNRSAAAEFAAQFALVDTAARELAVQAKSLQVRQGEQVSGTDLALLEVEVEFRAIDKILDQGARWLQDMRSQLKEREAAAGGDEATQLQVREDLSRCEILVGRLKTLRAASSAARPAHQQAQATAARRAALAQSLQQALTSALKDWRALVEPIARAAGDGDTPDAVPDAAMAGHRDLQLCVKQAIADCGQVQAHETATAESLDVLESTLRSASLAD